LRKYGKLLHALGMPGIGQEDIRTEKRTGGRIFQSAWRENPLRKRVA